MQNPLAAHTYSAKQLNQRRDVSHVRVWVCGCCGGAAMGGGARGASRSIGGTHVSGQSHAMLSTLPCESVPVAVQAHSTPAATALQPDSDMCSVWLL